MGRILDGRTRFRAAQIATLLRRSWGGQKKTPVPSPFSEGASFLLGAQGVRAAAWLAWRFRRQLREQGEARFHLPVTASLPGWFSRAIATLEGRPGWSVVSVRSEDGKDLTRWTIRWERRGRWARAEPQRA